MPASSVGALLASTAGMSADTAFTVAMAAGWIALVVAFAWPTPHCKCCAVGADEERRREQHRIHR
jgi:hypothetical protein